MSLYPSEQVLIPTVPMEAEHVYGLHGSPLSGEYYSNSIGTIDISSRMQGRSQVTVVNVVNIVNIVYVFRHLVGIRRSARALSKGLRRSCSATRRTSTARLTVR